MSQPQHPDDSASDEPLDQKVLELQTKLDKQYELNKNLKLKLQKYKKRMHSDDYKSDCSLSEIEPLSINVDRSLKKEEASSVNLMNKVFGGAVAINLCGCYKMQIYVHYWFWQIPFLITNVLLYFLWRINNNNILNEIALFAVGTVFITALIRDKMFLWVVYHSVQRALCCSKYARYHYSRIADCIGGLHSSFGVTAFVWNCIYARDMYVAQNKEWNVISVTGVCLPIMLSLICCAGLPCVRYYHHNYFEITHRYINWFALELLVVHIGFVNYNECIKLYANKKWQLIYHCIFNTPFVFAMFLVVLTVYPWFIIHRIKGRDVEIIPSKSGDSVAFLFPIWSPMGAVCKLSINWIEFHVMGITPLPYDENKGHRSLVLIKSLGDWTDSLNKKAILQSESDKTSINDLYHKNFWIHRIKPPNFSQGLFNWDKVVALATGIGIAPLIPYVVHPNYYGVQISLLWVARDHEANYPEFIVNILKPLKNVHLYDTTKEKRANLSLLTMQKVNDFNAEAVFVVSNPKIAYSVANYVNKQGIPVFASNWDV